MNGLQDRRRNLGPTDFVPLKFEQTQKEHESQLNDELRPIYMSQGVAKNASGSSYVEVGRSRIECCVFGPQPLRGPFQSRAEITVNVKVQQFASIAESDALERLTEDFVRSALLRAVVLENYPKSDISILLNVISGPESFSSSMAAAMNAATMALVNAGIAMHDMVTAAAVVMVDGIGYVDCEVDNSQKQLVAAYMTAQDLLVSFEVVTLEGLDQGELKAMLDRSSVAARDLRKIMNGYLVEDYASA